MKPLDLLFIAGIGCCCFGLFVPGLLMILTAVCVAGITE